MRQTASGCQDLPGGAGGGVRGGGPGGRIGCLKSGRRRGACARGLRARGPAAAPWPGPSPAAAVPPAPARRGSPASWPRPDVEGASASSTAVHATRTAPATPLRRRLRRRAGEWAAVGGRRVVRGRAGRDPVGHGRTDHAQQRVRRRRRRRRGGAPAARRARRCARRCAAPAPTPAPASSLGRAGYQARPVSAERPAPRPQRVHAPPGAARRPANAPGCWRRPPGANVPRRGLRLALGGHGRGEGGCVWEVGGREGVAPYVDGRESPRADQWTGQGAWQCAGATATQSTRRDPARPACHHRLTAPRPLLRA
jgi:hypothetical protein